MKCERQNRRLVISDLPPTIEGLKIPRRVTIDVDYGDDNESTPLRKALVLDNVILPAIVAALGGEPSRATDEARQLARDFLRLSDRDIKELPSLLKDYPWLGEEAEG